MSNFQPGRTVTHNRLLTTNLFAVICVVFFTIASTLSAFLLYFPSGQSSLSRYSDLFSTLFIYILGFGVPVFIYAMVVPGSQHRSVKEIFSFNPTHWGCYVLAVLIGFVAQPVAEVLATIASVFFRDIVSDSVDSLMAMPLWATILDIAVLPAFFEEITCRGMVQDGYRETPFWYQLLIPALFFGFLHGNFQQISYAFPFGLLLSFILLKTNSIYCTMLVHFIFNGSQGLLSWLQVNTDVLDDIEFSDVTGWDAVKESLAPGLLCTGILILLLILMVYLAERYQRKHPAKASGTNRPLSATQAGQTQKVGYGPQGTGFQAPNNAGYATQNNVTYPAQHPYGTPNTQGGAPYGAPYGTPHGTPYGSPYGPSAGTPYGHSTGYPNGSGYPYGSGYPGGYQNPGPYRYPSPYPYNPYMTGNMYTPQRESCYRGSIVMYILLCFLLINAIATEVLLASGLV